MLLHFETMDHRYYQMWKEKKYKVEFNFGQQKVSTPLVLHSGGRGRYGGDNVASRRHGLSNKSLSVMHGYCHGDHRTTQTIIPIALCLLKLHGKTVCWRYYTQSGTDWNLLTIVFQCWQALCRPLGEERYQWSFSVLVPACPVLICQVSHVTFPLVQ